MRLLVADHPFVDGNKRTALRTVVIFYMLNGYVFVPYARCLVGTRAYSVVGAT